MPMSGFAKITGLPVMTLTRINHALPESAKGLCAPQQSSNPSNVQLTWRESRSMPW